MIGKPHMRVLAYLAKAKRANSRQIVEHAKLDPAWLCLVYGRLGPTKAKKLTGLTPKGVQWSKRTGKTTLLGEGMVTGELVEVEGREEWLWSITLKGLAALKQAK